MHRKISLVQIFKCNFCLKTLSSQLKLKRHQQLHTGMNYFDFNHNNGIDLRKLLKLKHVSKNVYSRDKQFNCFLCCKQLRTSGDKNNHLKTHCGVKFQPQENVENTLHENNLSPNVQTQPLVNVEIDFHVINN